VQGRLLSSGVSGDTPCAIISGATSEAEEVCVTSVRRLHQAPRLTVPRLLVVGEVVRLAEPHHLQDQYSSLFFSTDHVASPITGETE
jgi:siroheme synthase